MIDFNNAAFVKLKPSDSDEFRAMIQPILLSGEQILGVYKGMRDGAMFTDKRIIAVNVQGITGKKKDFTSLPYNKVQAFSVETAGVFDLDAELDLWFSGLGKVRFEFASQVDITSICRVIGEHILGSPPGEPPQTVGQSTGRHPVATDQSQSESNGPQVRAFPAPPPPRMAPPPTQDAASPPPPNG